MFQKQNQRPDFGFGGLLVCIAHVQVIDGMFEPVNESADIGPHCVYAVNRDIESADRGNGRGLVGNIGGRSRRHAECADFQSAGSQGIDWSPYTVNTNRVIGIGSTKPTGLTEPVGRR